MWYNGIPPEQMRVCSVGVPLIPQNHLGEKKMTVAEREGPAPIRGAGETTLCFACENQRGCQHFESFIGSGNFEVGCEHIVFSAEVFSVKMRPRPH